MAAKMQRPQGVEPWPRWFDVEHESFGSFRIQLRKPTAAEQMEDSAIGAAAISARFRKDGDAEISYELRRINLRLRLVYDWEGVTDAEDRPVKFSPENLLAFVSEHGLALEMILGNCSVADMGMTLEELGKLKRTLSTDLVVRDNGTTTP